MRREIGCAIGVVCSLAGAARAEPCAAPTEPGLAALTAAALRTSALEPARVRALLRRARVAALLPQITVRVGRGNYDAIRNPDALDPSVTSSDTLRFDVAARFSLDRLIFDPHELHVTEAAGRIAEHRAVLVERIATLWAERRTLSRGADAPVEADERCTQLTTLLDVMTGGALGIVSRPTSFSLPGPRRRP